MIGKNIKKIREFKKLGLNEVARKAKMNASYLSSLELEKKTNPSLDKLYNIASVLNVNIDEFFKEDSSLECLYKNTTHKLKILPKYFIPILNRTKNFELRKNDRGFKVGDDIALMEYDNGAFTGRMVYREITYILEGGEYGLDKDYVILSLKESIEMR
jgi:transcriptional regulator with XRE-family HTH domain